MLILSHLALAVVTVENGDYEKQIRETSGEFSIEKFEVFKLYKYDSNWQMLSFVNCS